ncbi:MAG TPA: PLP-dependent aminotransferase family protein [Steroidobacteraceae bacterium]|jgi:DNA-binding transcriptional MocR family regulator|nr:PLP-dependent aminotransferase family protein [Steroidobacteraceae bacterium]
MPTPRVSSQTLVEECVQWAKTRISEQVYRVGMRMPSIRKFARQRGVSPFTVVDAYERLVATGYLEARRGSGFYVCRLAPIIRRRHAEERTQIDLRWLTRHMLESASARGPGLGVLPGAWLESTELTTALRSIARQRTERLFNDATQLGFPPLRSVVQYRLARLDIVTNPEQVLLTTGVTHALNLVLQTFVRPGETVLIPEPFWFGAHGMLATFGVNVIGVPCTPDGIDLAALERLVDTHRPRLLILSSAAHNPLGISLSAVAAARIFKLVEQRGVLIFEDDVYADLCTTAVTRLAAADRLRHVIYAGSFSKTLSSNVRVGFVACSPERAQALADTKILSGFTTPQLNERLVHKLLVEGQYDKHVAGLRRRLALHRRRSATLLQSHGVESFGAGNDGMFFWINMRTDTNELAMRWRDKGLLLAPGSLFLHRQAASEWMRFNVTTQIDRPLIELLAGVHGRPA